MKTLKRMAVFVATCVLTITMTSCSSKPAENSPSFAFYEQDGQLVMMDINTKTTYPLTTHALSTNGHTYQAGMPRITSDSTRLFYVDFESEAEDAARLLYMRDLTDLTAEPQFIDYTMGLYDVSEDGQTLLYVKGDRDNGYELYVYDFKTAVCVTEDLTGFGFTRDENLPYYTRGGQIGDATYYLVSDGKAMTQEEFENQTGGAAPYTYAVEGVSLQHMCLSYNGEVIDTEFPYTGTGGESYFTDRLLYFVKTDDAKLKIKEYIVGEEPVEIARVGNSTFPHVAYTSDGLPMYMQDYDFETKTGKLMLYRDGKSELLAEGVLIPVRLDVVVNYIYSIQKRMIWS